MRHYTASKQILITLIFIFTLMTHLSAKDYKLYQDCEEYYDSRGFYHNECEPNKFKKKKALKTFNQIYDFLEPGDGPKKLEEENTTQAADALLAPLKDEKSKREADSLFSDEKDDDKEEEELSQPESEIKSAQSNNKALKERPKLEFGRE